MISLVLFIFLLFLLWHIFKGLFVVGIYILLVFTLPLLLFLFTLLFIQLKNFIIFRMIGNQLDILTKKEVLSTLSDDEKRLLAKDVDLYLNSKNQWKRKILANLYYAGLGFTIADIGVKRAIRYGIGYAMLRKIVRGKKNNILNNI